MTNRPSIVPDVDDLADVRVTVLLSVAMIVGYVGTVQLAAGAGFGGPTPYLEGFLGDGVPLVVFAFPFLHADASHLLRNLAVFLAFGGLVEVRDGWALYSIFLSFTVLMANVLVPMLARGLLGDPFSGVGLGASGMTFALVARELVFRSSRLRPVGASWRDGAIFLASLLLSVVAVVAIFRLVNAWVSHLLGFAIGASIGLVEVEGAWSLQ
jgi:membrane associated rhomboid family serine protease